MEGAASCSAAAGAVSFRQFLRLLFGAENVAQGHQHLLEALQLRLQATNTLHIPYEIFLMLPFVLTIVAMALVSRNARAPAALLIPFRKEER